MDTSYLLGVVDRCGTSPDTVIRSRDDAVNDTSFFSGYYLSFFHQYNTTFLLTTSCRPSLCLTLDIRCSILIACITLALVFLVPAVLVGDSKEL